MKEKSPFPVVAYPSAVSASSVEVTRQALAAFAAGADGLMSMCIRHLRVLHRPEQGDHYDELKEIIGFLK